MTGDKIANAYIYVRVSTTLQDETGVALDAQVRACHEFLDRREDLVAAGGAHREVASGAVLPDDRPVLSALLEDLDRYGGVLVVSALDRLSRSTVHTLEVAARAREHGWGLVPIDHPELDTTTGIGEMVLTILASLAQLERRNISDRTKRALHELKQRGKRLGRPVEVPDESRRRLRELRAEGLSLVQTARVLTEEEMPTARGGKWWPATIRECERSDRLDQLADEYRLRHEEARQ